MRVDHGLLSRCRGAQGTVRGAFPVYNQPCAGETRVGGIEVEIEEAEADDIPASRYPEGEGGTMLFMVIERFKNRDGKGVYRHFLEKGRGLPEGLTFVGSWTEANFDRCFQLMECSDARLLQRWVLHWQGLVEFEIIPVVPSKETMETITPFL